MPVNDTAHPIRHSKPHAPWAGCAPVQRRAGRQVRHSELREAGRREDYGTARARSVQRQDCTGQHLSWRSECGAHSSMQPPGATTCEVCGV